jgi:hypothetical protein
MTETARALARTLNAGSAPREELSARIQRAYQQLYGRPATAREVALGRAYLEHQSGAAETDSLASGSFTPERATANPSQSVPEDLSRWERYAQALLATNEFMYVD